VQVLQLLISGIAQGCIYGLIALGFVLIYKATETVSFAQGELMMLGAFVALAAMTMLGFPYWLAVLSSIVGMALFGIALERLVIRPILGQPAFSIVMLTIGVGYVARGLITMIPNIGTETHTLPVPYKDEIWNLAGLVLNVEQMAVIAVTTVLCALLFALFRYSKLGIAMQAASQNQLAAYYSRVPVRRLVSVIWAIAALVAAFAGVLMAPITQIDTEMSLFGIKAIAGAVVGGFGSIPGALIGCLIIGVSEPFLDYLYPPLKGVYAYIILLAVLFVRPEGLIPQTYQKKV
jgi:branched-chain amino acid transport system permease protein